MKAVVYTQYGTPDVLRLEEVEKPTPKDNEVLIKVVAASLNAADGYFLKGNPVFLRLTHGFLKPKNTILGSDVAGRVEAVGSKVTQFQPGDEVFGDLSESGLGGFAEYVCARETALTLKPAFLSFEQAASMPMAAVTALQGLRDQGKIQPGHKVLIHGASGGVGTFAVQIAKALGAEVTGVCSSRKLDLVRSLGADYVLDYIREDFTQNRQRYDLILAVNGNRSPFEYQRSLSARGNLVVVGGSMAQIFQTLLLGPLLSLPGKKKMGNLLAKPNPRDLAFIMQLFEKGQLVPVIDRRYPLSELADAFRYLEGGHARGKVVITI